MKKLAILAFAAALLGAGQLYAQNAEQDEPAAYDAAETPEDAHSAAAEDAAGQPEPEPAAEPPIKMADFDHLKNKLAQPEPAPAAAAEPAPPPAKGKPAKAAARGKGKKPKVAVYVTGNFKENEKRAFGTRMLTSLVNSGRYTAIERTNAFLAAVDKEMTKQRSGDVDDSQINRLGAQFGVKYVCIVNITPIKGSYQISARIVDVETAHVLHIGETYSSLKNTKDLLQSSGEVMTNLFKRKTKTRVSRMESENNIVIARSAATKQSRRMDCFAPLAMTIPVITLTIQPL